VMRLHPQPVAVHGGAGHGIDLSASLNPLGASLLAVEAARMARLDRYPEPDAASLRRAAARRHAIPEDRIVPVPGASFGLWFLMTVLLQPGDLCLALVPCFSEYRRAAAIAQAEYREVLACEPSFEWDLAEVDRRLASGTRMCLLANPANPSGRSLRAAPLRDLCEAHRHTTFVVDEAFASFGPHGCSLLDGTSVPENAIVVRSLTKELGLPGLRMGYLVASPRVAQQIAGMMPPWPLSAESLAAAVAGMNDRAHISDGARVAYAYIRELESALHQVGRQPVPTDVNYLLVRSPGTCLRLAAAGITIRDCASFGLPAYVRIAAPMPKDLSFVLQALRELDG
jgi:histidinol-phosphate/aromatic aminotransferase/cobyric acid decarboxylase-like protein